MCDICKNYNLTIPQENIWLIEELNPDKNINNILGTFRINKKLDIGILKKAINKIIETNDALRIRIKKENNSAYQYITNFEYEDLKTYTLNENDDIELNKIVNKIAKQRIEILDNKLYDIQIIQNNVETCVCVKTHHIISDAWTLGQIAEQIKENYIKVSSGEEITLKPSYLEYIKKDENYRISDKYISDKEFWENYVKELECENKYEITKDKKSRRIEKSISIETYNKIHQYCEENKITEYAFFLAVISIYFSKIYNKDSVVIGTPFLNRRKADKELEMMGMFIATLPINIQTKQDMTFNEVCKNIASTNMQCFRHSKYPYSEIQKSYQEFTKEKTNLYEIAFSYQINKLEVELDNDTGKTTWIPNNMQANPLLISYVNHFGEHILYYDYMLNCMQKNDIDEMHKRILYIINQIIKTNSIKLENISILSERDVALIGEFNRTGISKPINETITSKFEKIVETNENKIAISCGDDKLTYNQLNAIANQISNNIQEEGIIGKAIAIVLDRETDFISSILGVLKSGNYYVPILPEESKERMQYIIKDSNSQIIMTNKKYMQKVSDIELKKINMNKLKTITTNNQKKDIKPNDMCYLIYTSGTTGKPKGVMMKNENIISLINSMNLDEDLKFIKDDVSISLLKHSFDASAIDIFSSLLNGGKLVLIPKEHEFNSDYVVNRMKEEGVTRVFTVHKWIEQIQSVTNKNNIELDLLRIIGTGAEVLKPKKFELLLKNNPNLRIYNTYGPTEATMFMTKHKINNQDIQNDSAPIGKLMPNTRAFILDKNNSILPINVQGELVIYEDDTSSKNIAKGYYNKENLTKEKFIRIKNLITGEMCNCYKTGDIARINNDLELEFLGRKDDFIKVAGRIFNIFK